MSSFKKIAVFGGTGFIGSYIVETLLENGYKPSMLVRNKETNKSIQEKGATLIEGDINDIDIVKKIVEGSEVVIYAIGIIREYPKQGITYEKLHYEYFKQIVDIAKIFSVNRIIYVSANGVDNLNTEYQTSKYIAEQYIAKYFKNWTIFRPSVVYGNPGEKIEFLTQLKNDIIDKAIPAPLFYRMNPFESKSFFRSNPVHVKDLSKLIVKSIESVSSNKKIYKVGGPDETTWYSMLKSISSAINKKKLFFPLPIALLQLLATLLDRFAFFPITSTQLKMLKEDNSCESIELFKQYKITPTRFSEDSISYLKQKHLK